MATPAMYEGITNYLARAMYDQGHDDNQGGRDQGYSNTGSKYHNKADWHLTPGILMPTHANQLEAQFGRGQCKRSLTQPASQ